MSIETCTRFNESAVPPAAAFRYTPIMSSSRSPNVEVVGRGRAVGSGLLTAGLLSLLFGLAIIMAPELLAYIVASFFIVTGVSLLMTWWTLRG